MLHDAELFFLPPCRSHSYVTIYAHNGPYRVGGAPFLQTGAHDVRGGAGSMAACRWLLSWLLPSRPALLRNIPAQPAPTTFCLQGDIEHCTARVDHQTGDLLGFWFNAHRSRDGCWVAAPQVGGSGGQASLSGTPGSAWRLTDATTKPLASLLPAAGAALPRRLHCLLRCEAWAWRVPRPWPCLPPLFPWQRPVQQHRAGVAPTPRGAAAAAGARGGGRLACCHR